MSLTDRTEWRGPITPCLAVCGMRRSGHHAILSWLMQEHAVYHGTVLHLNACEADLTHFGGYIYRGIQVRDGVAVVGAVTALVIIYLFVNLIVDLLYGVLDPRISHD